MIFKHLKNGIISYLNGFLPLKGHLEFSGFFFPAEILEKVSLDPYNFRMKNFYRDKNMPISIVFILYLPFFSVPFFICSDFLAESLMIWKMRNYTIF